MCLSLDIAWKHALLIMAQPYQCDLRAITFNTKWLHRTPVGRQPAFQQPWPHSDRLQSHRLVKDCRHTAHCNQSESVYADKNLSVKRLFAIGDSTQFACILIIFLYKSRVAQHPCNFAVNLIAVFLPSWCAKVALKTETDCKWLRA